MWEQVDMITTYTVYMYGFWGDQPGKIQVVLESNGEFFRWAVKDYAGIHECGPATSKDEAIAGGLKFAKDSGE